ncbi:MAG: TlpA disulfide reductase family protein, partial [Planctomycetota bacterium]
AGALACLCWLAALTAGDQTALADQKLAGGDPMPAFSLPRSDGVAGELGLEHLKGRPAVLVFWRPRQDLSLEALRDLEALLEELGAQRLAVLAVDSARSSAQEVQSALAGENLSYPVVLDPQRALYGQAGVIVSPTSFLLDADGVLRFKVASHPHQYRQVVRARLRYLLGDIDQAQMDREIEPTVLKIDHDLAAAWRMYNLGRKLQGEGKPDEAIAMSRPSTFKPPSPTSPRPPSPDSARRPPWLEPNVWSRQSRSSCRCWGIVRSPSASGTSLGGSITHAARTAWPRPSSRKP